MRRIITLCTCICISLITTAQLCPGGGLNFAGAVFFDPAWISGCSTGTSCTGGTIFDNRAACQPTTTIDACAPAPSCVILANTGSNLWYKFYASGTTASINIIQSVSFIACIQAFSGGPACGALTQIGCVEAGGPSSGVILNLSGLTAGNLYYYRVFGTASAASQRTGTYCFCGSAGMKNVPLPLKLLSLNAAVSGSSVWLKWLTTAQVNFSHFEIERSNNAVNFTRIGSTIANNSNALEHEYAFQDLTASGLVNFYRLKMIDADERFEYSNIIKVNTAQMLKFGASVDNQNHRLLISIDKDCDIDVFTLMGEKLTTLKVKLGINNFYCKWINGVYLVRRDDTGITQKVTILK